MENDDEDIFVGKWFEYPLIRNAIISGSLTIIALGLAHTGRIPPQAEISVFLVAIVIGIWVYALMVTFIAVFATIWIGRLIAKAGVAAKAEVTK
jgi:hypothetical protein